MIFGITLTSLTFISLVICIVSYLVAQYNKNDDYANLARLAYYFSSVIIFIQAALLMWGILSHQFQWQYVFSYSSTDMSVYYLITTFWGGQEGTFLLWLVLGSIYGIVIIRNRREDEKIVMAFMALVMAFIAMILIKKNPFTYVWDARPMQFQPGQIPVDGNGLNPLLQDPWMIIHPPILFTGYSSTMILFAYAMAALIRKDFTTWVKRVYPYSVFVALSLGTGIILGGYWAYTTLGWGGYWGWDPVENSSFVPWVASLALVHGLIIQRKQGGLQRTNIFLALLTFLLVLYGSFLTRSGVLADFSVHSFSESEINSYLVLFLIFFMAIGAIFFILRRPETRSSALTGHFLTRENFMFFGMLTLLTSGILTFAGTSAPLFSGIFLDQASDVSIEYYNLLNTPVAILLGFFIAISPLLSWKKKNPHILSRVKFHLLLSGIITVAGYFLGLKHPIHFIIFFLFVFAVLVNLEIVTDMIKKKNWAFGGYLSHVGIGLMMMGIITSSAYDKTTKTTLPFNQSTPVFDYQMKYAGFRTGADGKNEAVITITGSMADQLEATPKYYWSEFNRAYMRNPSVHNLWTKDIYVSAIQVIPPDEQVTGQKLDIQKGGQAYFEDYLVNFTGYEMDSHNDGNQETRISAVLNIKVNGVTHTVKPALLLQKSGRVDLPAEVPGANKQVSIHNINVNSNTLTLLFTGDDVMKAGMGVELLAVEITEKPLINLLWLGTMLMISGLVITMIYRIKLAKS